MTIDKLQEFDTAEPFRPFVFRMLGGREIDVHSREFIPPAPSVGP